MNITKLYYFFTLIVILPFLVLQNTGCRKEYSIEGIDSARVVRDTLSPSPAPPVGEFPNCSLCNPKAVMSTGEWNFETGNSFLCGGVTNSGFFSGYSKEDITLFGPSACSIDTGLVLSVYLPVPLDQDRFNLTATSAAFYYYDHNAPNDIFISLPTEPFSVTIQSFIYATGVTTGVFSGIVYRANGDTAFISNGKFKVLVK